MPEKHAPALFPGVIEVLTWLQKLPAYRELDHKEMTRRVHLFLNAIDRALWAAESGRDLADTSQAILRNLQLARREAAHERVLLQFIGALDDALGRLNAGEVTATAKHLDVAYPEIVRLLDWMEGLSGYLQLEADFKTTETRDFLELIGRIRWVAEAAPESRESPERLCEMLIAARAIAAKASELGGFVVVLDAAGVGMRG